MSSRASTFDKHFAFNLAFPVLVYIAGSPVSRIIYRQVSGERGRIPIWDFAEKDGASTPISFGIVLNLHRTM
jgi:hypothetical protein